MSEACGVNRASQCDAAINAQDAEISELGVIVDNLEGRLASCLTEPTPSTSDLNDTFGKSSDLVKTAQRINDAVSRTRIINERLRKLTDRIEL